MFKCLTSIMFINSLSCMIK